MGFIASGVAATSTGGIGTYTVTVPAGITADKTMVIVVVGSTSAPDHLDCVKTGATITPYNATTGAWDSSSADTATAKPLTTTNSIFAMWKLTGVAAGDVVSILAKTASNTTGSLLGDVNHWYHDGDISLVSSFAVKSAKSAVAPAITVPSGQQSFAVGMSRGSGITITGAVNSLSSATVEYNRTDGTSAPICVAELVGFVPPGTSSGTTTFSFSTSNTNGGALTYSEAPPAAPSGSLRVPPRAGGRTTTSVKVAVDATNATAAVATAATDTGLTTNAVSSSSVTLDSDGLGIAEITGLIPDTDYYAGVSLDGVAQAERATFRTAKSGASSYSWWLASCMGTGTNPTTLDAIRTRVGAAGKTANFGVLPGDIHYQGRNTSDTSVILSDWRAVIAQSRPQAIFTAMAVEYTWSDHDLGPDQCDSVVLGSAVIAANRTTFARYWPTYDYSDPSPYRSWTDGRVHYILTEGRTYMTSITGTDNATKTKLGATQLAWLFDEFLAAKAAGLAIVWMHEDGGQTASSAYTNDDSWAAFNYEATVIANFISDNDLGSRMLYVHGDYHAMGADDGTNCVWGIPSICAAPIQREYFMPSQDHWSNGEYPPTDPGTTLYQYGWFDVVDDGGATLQINFTGYSNDGTGGTTHDTSRLTLSATLDTGPTISVWDGTTEIPASMTEWNGTAEVATTFEIA